MSARSSSVTLPPQPAAIMPYEASQQHNTRTWSGPELGSSQVTARCFTVTSTLFPTISLAGRLCPSSAVKSGVVRGPVPQFFGPAIPVSLMRTKSLAKRDCVRVADCRSVWGTPEYRNIFGLQISTMGIAGACFDAMLQSSDQALTVRVQEDK